MQFLLYAAEGTAPDYYVGSLCFDYVGDGMLFWLPTHLTNVVSHFGFYKIAEKMRMDPVLVVLAFHRVTEIDLSSSWGSDEFPSYDLATGTVQGYPAERFGLVKCQNVDGGLWFSCCHLLSMLANLLAWRVRRC